MKKIVSFFVAGLLFWTLSCQSLQYGPAVSAKAVFFKGANSANGEFETDDEPEKDKVGMWIFVGIAAAAGVASAVIVPMAIGGKL